MALPLLLELALNACSFVCGIITAASVTISQGDFSGISVCIAVFCFSTILYWVYSVCVDGEARRGKVWMTFSLLISGVFLFFLLVTGCILKVGRDKLCDSVVNSGLNITQCDQAQSKKWKSPLIGSSFYSKLHSAETAVWVNFFCWIIVVILVVVQLKRGSEHGTRVEDPGASPSETEPFFKRPGQQN